MNDIISKYGDQKHAELIILPDKDCAIKGLFVYKSIDISALTKT